MLEKAKTFRKKVENAMTLQIGEIVSVADALGRVLSCDVSARCTSPQSDKSAVNGYAVISGDVKQIPATLDVIGTSQAREPFLEKIEQGQAVKVFAGAAIPEGAEVVIPIENAEIFGNHVIVNEISYQGENICYRGLDFSEGEIVLKEGSVVTARDTGLSAAMNVSWLPVRRKPRIAVLAVGDELTMLGDTEKNHRIISSSSVVFCAFITACGAIPVNLGITTDDDIATSGLDDAIKGVDLLVTTGGLSVANESLIKHIVDKCGANELKINLGKKESVLLSESGGTPILSMPGNPISAEICAALFLRPAIEKMLKMEETFYKKSFAILGRQLDINDEKMDFVFAKLVEDSNKQLVAMPASSQDRLLLSELAASDCIVCVDKDNLSYGSHVEIVRFTCSVVSG